MWLSWNAVPFVSRRVYPASTRSLFGLQADDVLRDARYECVCAYVSCKDMDLVRNACHIRQNLENPTISTLSLWSDILGCEESGRTTDNNSINSSSCFVRPWALVALKQTRTMPKSDDWRVTDDGRIYRTGRKAYPNGDKYSVWADLRGNTKQTQ